MPMMVEDRENGMLLHRNMGRYSYYCQSLTPIMLDI